MRSVLLQCLLLPPIYCVNHPHALKHEQLDVVVCSSQFSTQFSTNCAHFAHKMRSFHTWQNKTLVIFQPCLERRPSLYAVAVVRYPTRRSPISILAIGKRKPCCPKRTDVDRRSIFSEFPTTARASNPPVQYATCGERRQG
jgi:hypothetical protein